MSHVRGSSAQDFFFGGFVPRPRVGGQILADSPAPLDTTTKAPSGQLDSSHHHLQIRVHSSFAVFLEFADIAFTCAGYPVNYRYYCSQYQPSSLDPSIQPQR